MALGWAIYGTWNWWTWWLHEILEHEMSFYIFLNTNNSNNTNVFWHTDLTDLTDFELLMFEHEFYSHGFWVFGSLWMTARCGCWLVVVIGLLWLLTHCGYWFVVVIDLLWLLTCYVLNDKSKKISVCLAKHWQIREIREIRVRNKYIRAIRSSCERTAANKDPWDPCA